MRSRSRYSRQSLAQPSAWSIVRSRSLWTAMKWFVQSPETWTDIMKTPPHAVVCRTLVFMLVVASAATVISQQGRGAGGRSAAAPGPPADPKDLSGIWLGRAVQRINTAPPVFTTAGKAAFDDNKPSFGLRAVPPAVGNDPLGGANPPGQIGRAS